MHGTYSVKLVQSILYFTIHSVHCGNTHTNIHMIILPAVVYVLMI